MASVKDIAAYALRTSGPMSAMKLQKLVYYSQAWFLVARGRALFSEAIQAWAHGPVVYELFDLHRGKYAVSDLGVHTADLTPEERSVVDVVLAHYGRMKADQLSAATHAEDPWREARAGVADGQRASAVITQESMKRFYSTAERPFAI